MFKEQESRVLVLLSGGLDSSLTSAYLKQRGYSVYGLFVDRGQKNLEKELQATNRISEILNLRLFQSSFSLKSIRNLITPEILNKRGIPGRNLIFISLATPYADVLNCDIIATGNVTSDDFSDCNTKFRESFSPVISQVLERNVLVVSPFADWEGWDKAGEIRWGIENGYEEIIKATWTCWALGQKHCGECNACLDRKEGFRKVGVQDPTNYLVP